MSRFWLRLDNAALIFPSVRRPDWTNVFRLSVTLTEDISPAVLQTAVGRLKKRFPSLYVRIRGGVFWYYLEEIKESVRVSPDYAYPNTHMGAKELRSCCLRVLYYKKRIAVEFFHALTDGTGGSIYMKTLVAEYVSLKYGVKIPPENGILNSSEAPDKEEIEDSFLKYTGKYALNTSMRGSYRLRGHVERGGFKHITTGIMSSSALRAAAKRHGVTVTSFLAAVMIESIIEIQEIKTPEKRRKPVRVTVPVNLRRFFPSKTLRNFVLVLNLGVDPRLGKYTFDEICKSVTNQLAEETRPQILAAKIASNVNPQKIVAMQIVPLFLKNILLKFVYSAVGECMGCLNISNLGVVDIPDELKKYVERFEFVIGVQYTYPNNCSIATCGDTVCINMIRNIQETELERRFFSKLVEFDIPVEIESNDIRGE